MGITMGITSEQLRQRLEDSLQARVDVEDQSHLHAGHEGAKDGGKHFKVHVVSERFKGLGTLARHRLVYDSVSDWMKKEIHALAITASHE